MPKPKVLKLAKQDFDSMRITSPNMVLIHITEKNTERRTAGGIYIAVDTDWNQGEHAQRYGQVVRIPTHLKRRKDHLWKTTCEVEVGDRVWFDPMIASNCDQIIVDTETYYLIEYQSLHVMRRLDKIITANGYALFSNVEEERKSQLSVNMGRLDARYGIVTHLGSKNEYYFPGLSDDSRIQVGDKCIFKQPPVMLESETHAVFDDKKQYRISHLHNVVGFIREGKLYACDNHVAISPEMPSHTSGGIEIPLPYRKPTGMGKVYDSGYYEVVKDDEVSYAVGSSVKIEFEDKPIHLVHYHYINFIKQ